MTRNEFIERISVLDAYPPRPKDEAEYQARLRALWLVAKRFDADVLATAIARFCESDAEYFPVPGRIVKLCREVRQDHHSALAFAAAEDRSPLKHNCSTLRAPTNEALGMLQSYAGYEARHVLCNVPAAVCPKCGRQHKIDHPLIAHIMNQYPEQTSGWLTNAKGLFLCEQCDQGIPQNR